MVSARQQKVSRHVGSVRIFAETSLLVAQHEPDLPRARGIRGAGDEKMHGECEDTSHGGNLFYARHESVIALACRIPHFALTSEESDFRLRLGVRMASSRG